MGSVRGVIVKWTRPPEFESYTKLFIFPVSAISHDAYTLRYSTIVGPIGLFNLGMATDLGENLLNSA